MPPDQADEVKPLTERIGERAALKALWSYLWPPGRTDMKARVVIALACLFAAKIATVYVPFFYKDAVDALSATGDLALALPLGAILAYGVARVLSLVFSELRNAIFAKVGIRAIRNAALNVFRHLHGLALRFHLDRQTGGLSRVIERGTNAIESLLRVALFSIVPTLMEILLVTGILWSLFDASFAVVTLLTVVGYIAFTLWVTEWRLKFRRRMNQTDQEAYSKAIDSLLNYETVKYFGNEEHEAARFDDALRRYEGAAVKSQTSLALLNTGQILIIAGGLTSVMYLAARGIVDGNMTIGDFVLVNTYLMQLYQPLNFFGTVYRSIKQNLIDMENLFGLLRAAPEVADAADAQHLSVNRAVVEFDDVYFSYDSRRPVLCGVSFRVDAGQTVAIVGPTGSGKSTIARLLYRFYDCDRGEIRIDGQPLLGITQASLRAAIGVVPQDTVLFNESIYYNIAYGNPGQPAAEVERAARLAHIHDFIVALPDGYETVVGERGLKLSGGEKQRVAIARTLLKNPHIFLFDEATSALDTHTERQIQGNLNEISSGRTTLIIAHRLSTVIEADEILVVDSGRIAERGRHSELLTLQGRYAALWRRQQAAPDIAGVETASAPTP